MSKKVLDATEVKAFIDRVGDHIDSRYDHTYSPQFPENRQDVCVVNRMVEDGHSYGYNVVYLVWLENGRIYHEEIKNTRSTKDYISIDSITVDDNDVVTVIFGSGGMFSGSSWTKSEQRKKT